MQQEDGWQGLGREWQLALGSWRSLEDNPLWLLHERMQTRSAARLRRRRRSALWIWSVVLLAFYSLIFCTIVLAGGGWPSLEEFTGMLVYGMLAPLLAVFLLYAIAQLALQGQAWLGRERGDARNLKAALLDPLLGLTQIDGRSVVVAALRSHAPLLLWACGSAATAATIIIVLAALDAGYWMAVMLAPLTLLGYLLPGLLGGLILLLLSFCLGLNSSSPSQRTALVVVFILHQLFGFGFSFAGLAMLEFAQSELIESLTGFLAAQLYIFAAAAAGYWLLRQLRTASTSWLLAVPMLWVLGFYMAVAMVAIYIAVTGSSWDPLDDAAGLGTLTLGMLSSWCSINLFAPGNLLLMASVDNHGSVTGQAFATTCYLLRLGLLFMLAGLAYRAALYCAVLRLNASE